VEKLVRAKDEDWQRWQREAKAAGYSNFSLYIRDCLNAGGLVGQVKGLREDLREYFTPREHRYCPHGVYSWVPCGQCIEEKRAEAIWGKCSSCSQNSYLTEERLCAACYARENDAVGDFAVDESK
jgi:hypothetical protein